VALRVVHCGTGPVGRAAVAGIVNHPDLELVGHHVWSPDKVGIDSGTLCGLPEIGVVATDDWAALYDLEADCLSYCGDSIGRELEAADDVCRFLARGTNAVTVSNFPWAYPDAAPPAFGDAVRDACAQGRSTAFFTGIDPGWATTDLAIAALAVADRVECVRVQELGWFGMYTAEHLMREYFGFGKPKTFVPILLTGGFLMQMWTPTLMHLADALHVEIEDWNVVYETDSVDVDTETGFGMVEAGTASVVHFELQALSGGAVVAVVEHVDRVARSAGPQWAQPYGPGELSYRVGVEGDPAYTVELNFDVVRCGAKLTAMPAINAIPVVCAANPGLKGPLDIPRYTARATCSP
jgi:hypothetical protein